jgi:hypothetical protein
MVNKFPTAGADYIYANTIELYDSWRMQSALVYSASYVTQHTFHRLAEFFSPSL